MNTDTGHLVTGEELEGMEPELKELYDPVPDELTLSAQIELMGKDQTFVGKEATSGIALWARSKRDRLKSKGKQRKRNKIHCR